MKFGFSPTTSAFYLMAEKESYIRNHLWPDDISLVSDDTWSQYCGEPPEGKVRGSDEQGLPCWTNGSLPSDSEPSPTFQTIKNIRLSEAIDEISGLAIIASVTPLTDSDQKLLAEWKCYLSNIYNMTGPDKHGAWPAKPESI
ncbi:tail fiber assembly protein [Pantoea piersonii]|jgi:hypothetical protein|uniref:tail fiber assembly protein n=1 Tax=Pantoea piersonii TaxID=2364647 RepID=UPI000EA27E66|nr:tail fiber assembly protein [Pantoea piersonii]MBZ6386812.1 tail fiber assembly protein [Pantoea piersonii]MBZ6400039.1 tail fiber assembly protein [Pantoea piersonii]MBZ6409093.1 tail fiber assembly protein [Pantoea piersonii]MBZ6426090.1 tail fiber assembly protein [Pantoea piersonii]NYB04685.1 tail fiber assembly protein [Pantoea piersonii]